MGLADIHIHAIYSHDATTTVRGVLRQASNVGYHVIASGDGKQSQHPAYAA